MRLSSRSDAGQLARVLVLHTPAILELLFSDGTPRSVASTIRFVLLATRADGVAAADAETCWRISTASELSRGSLHIIRYRCIANT